MPFKIQRTPFGSGFEWWFTTRGGELICGSAKPLDSVEEARKDISMAKSAMSAARYEKVVDATAS